MKKILDIDLKIIFQNIRLLCQKLYAVGEKIDKIVNLFWLFLCHIEPTSQNICLWKGPKNVKNDNFEKRKIFFPIALKNIFPKNRFLGRKLRAVAW